MTNRTKVFISYSRNDKFYLDELVPFLSIIPHINDKLWYDGGGIDIGDRFDDTIKQALNETRVGVLLLSEHFFASSYIKEKELPYLVQQAESRGLTLCLVFLVELPQEAYRLTFKEPYGSHEVNLLEIHGVNNPSQALNKQSEADRKATYKQLADWIANTLSSRPSSRRTYDNRPELVISLQFQHGHWHHRYSLAHAHNFKLPHFKGPRFEDVVDGENGDLLFSLLFGGNEETYQAILAEAFGTGKAALPTRKPLRVRMITNDVRIYSLPWSKLAFKGRPLSADGWTVEFHDPSETGFPTFPPHICHFPGKVMICGSDEPKSIIRAHLLDLLHFFQHRWPQTPVPQWVNSAATFREVLASGSTRFVYFVGPARNEGLCFHGQEHDGDLLSWQEMAALLTASRSVSIVFFNLVGEDSTELIQHGQTILAGVKAAVLFQCSPKNASANAGRAAMEWMGAVLSGNEKRDPVQELHRYASGNTAAWSRYSHWEVIAPMHIENPDWVKILLDRRKQRAEILQAKKDFVTTFHHRRIYHAVAFGGIDCMTTEFPHTAGQHLRMNKDDKEVVIYQPMELSPTIQSVEKMDDYVRQQIRANPSSSVIENLVKEETLVGNQFMYLLLGWLLKRPVTHPVTAKALVKSVTEWCRVRLFPDTGTGKRFKKVRVISILAVEAVSDEILAMLEEEMSELAVQLDHDHRFHIGELDRLSGVTRRDLGNYFDDSYLCRCDDRYRKEFPHLLLAGRRQMPFSEAVDTIQRGAPHNWANLAEELKNLKNRGTWPPATYDRTFWKRPHEP